MDKEEKLKMLQQLDEKNLTNKFVIPLYESEKMGCKNVQYTHKKLEFGKDIIYYKDDEHKNRIYTAISIGIALFIGGSGLLMSKMVNRFWYLSESSN